MTDEEMEKRQREIINGVFEYLRKEMKGHENMDLLYAILFDLGVNAFAKLVNIAGVTEGYDPIESAIDFIHSSTKSIISERNDVIENAMIQKVVMEFIKQA